MSRAIRIVAIIPSMMATAILAFVVMRGAHTVLRLREYGDTTYPLVAPITFVPAALIALSFLLFADHRIGPAAVLGVLALATATLFFVSQASGALG
jgi:hypothetical protein